ncbi:bifunctional DNA-formamidopyrimidine glycosylase/DNA-(apurinic or apyrimidinic site) lyase [Aquabacterium sp. A7-Y]|uniref:bifunctional DNA-formamidopyrimidine glycosylase/DNA-(apurinic or apyrimidinic site) lyase n=1 Tax=Aquabacterium sp. A7-Y TaxID=1349605 RepID=UPI00223DD04B|nr:bifunctional DNA-formamidopyrimidine glycosylase/DNA-(apurinic or apyrimidinic site) lyase [Aquabacterium sp. A7-Y]MCW7537486.1 bifunctional DNA-formamidopyrimidine glycosylase/DNA-(apurinic or apyrimidinic site) lyase [Aquabacterium sp. A7-Y]
MPELPEVEVTRQSFADRIRGAQVEAVRIGKPLRWPLGCDPAELTGQRVGEVTRRGKYLWLALERGGLLLHLGMSGSLSFAIEAGPAGPHDHFDLQTSHGLLRLHDPRRFGAVVWSSSLQHDPALKLLSSLGVEPFDPGFTAAHLHASLRGRRVSIKQALLAGDVVVGVGNIYASEALFSAGIDPRTPAGRVGPARCQRLVDAVRATLTRALEAGGSTLRDFRDAQGHNGAFQLEARVYDRAGQACRVCGSVIRRIQQGQRSTFFCPTCQKR